MTDVGKISLGVEIDASDLSARLGEAVRRAIGPALAEIQRELEKTQREYEKTARTSEKSTVAQTAGAKAVAKAVEQVGDEQTKTARKTAAAGQLTTRQINAVTRALDKQTHAWERNAAARVAASAAPTPGGAGGGGPPGRGFGMPTPGRGGGVGAHRGGFMQGGKGRFGFLTSPVGVNAIALGIGSLPAALTAVTNLTGAVQQLGQAGLLLPTVFGAAGASIGTAMLGFKGMGDAVKTLTEALKTGDPKDLEKATAALKDMDPAAQGVAKTVAGLNRGPLLDLQKMVQGHMFAGFDKDLQSTADKVIPRLSGNIGKIGDAWNGTLKQVTGSLGAEKNLSLIDRFLGNTAEGQKRANGAIDPIIHAFATLMSTGGEFLPRLGDALTKVATRFDNFISKAGASGDLWKWMDEGINGARALGDAVINVFKTIGGLTKAAGGDGGFLGWLERSTGKLNELVNSTKGQSALGKFFREGTDQMHEWGPILQNIGKALIEVYKASSTWTHILLPFLRTASDLITAMPGLVTAVGVAFLAWKTAGIFRPILSGLDSMAAKLDNVATKTDIVMGNKQAGRGGISGALKGGRKVLGALGSTKGILGLGFLAGGAATQLTSGQENTGAQVLGAASTIGGGALTGAAIGSVIPGIGTAIGAGAGAAVGAAIAGINFLLADNKTAQEAAAAATEKLAAANERANQAFEANSQAIKTMNDALTASGGAIDASTLAAVADQINNIPDKLSGAFDDSTLKSIASALGDVGMTTEQMAGTITGSQAQFDALIARLTGMGEPGRIAAEQLASIRDNTLGVANNATIAAPLLQALSEQFGGIVQAGVGVQNVFAALPKDTPLNVHMAGVDGPGGVVDILTKIGAQVDANADGTIHLSAPLSEEVLGQLHALGIQIQQNKDGTIDVSINASQYADTLAKLGNLGAVYRDLFSQQLQLPPVPNAPAPRPILAPGADIFTPPKAGGGVFPGYAPGMDSLWARVSPGEGVLIPEAVRGIGGAAAVYAINSAYRPGLSRKGYAGGGIVGFDDGGVQTGMGTGVLPGPETELDVLKQIRDLLGGKGGVAAPLNATAANTADLSTAAKTAAQGGQEIGPFGTPLKKKNRAYDAAKGALNALGFDAETIIGSDPTTYQPQTSFASGAPGTAGMGMGVDFASVAAQLAKFAISGNLADVSGLGLNANSPVVGAITSARNKKKGMGDQDISDLVTQIVGGTGFTGVLDPQNTPIIKSLQSFHDSLAKKGAIPGVAPGMTAVAPTGFPMPAVAGGPKGSKAGLQPAAANLWNVIAQQFPQIAEIGGVRADALPFHPSGRALDLMIPGAGGLNDPTPPAGKALGDQIFQFLTDPANAAALGIDTSGTLWQQKDHFNHIHAQLLDQAGFTPGAGLSMPGGMSGLSTAGLGSPVSGAGTPVFITNWPGQGGQLPGFAKDMLGAGMDAASQAATGVIGDIGSATTSAFAVPADQRQPNADFATLRDQQNPEALAAALGFNVQDFSRFGGAGTQGVDQTGGGFDASGRLFSDTASLIDRTFTSLNAQLDAMKQQLTDTIQQVADKLNQDAVEPIIKAGVQSALADLKDSVLSGLGTAIGQAAAPPIADAVKSAVASLPVDSSGAGNTGGAAAGVVTGFIPGLASGGSVTGGVPGKDSVPAWLMPGEHVFTTKEVAKLGGQSGAERFRASLMNGSIRKFATGGGVNVNDVVGAEFFGVSEVPIIGTIVNLLIRVLLKVIGVEIEARDTLSEMSNDFRSFRGDAFKAFDAQGRLLNDTSGLIERSSTSTDVAAEERIRILKIVIQAIIKYLIEKVIVPITKAVANAAIQGGASAAGAAISGAGGGPAGGIVSSIISSAGQAGVDIAAEVGTDFALAISQTLIDMVAEGLTSQFPDLATGIFGGGALAGLFDPLGGGLGNILGSILGIFTGLIGGGVFGGASTLIPGLPFDNGGMASGVGYLPKATMADELVLSPGETDLFSRFVSALERGGFGKGGNTTSVHAPITVIGGRESATQVQNRLLKLMP